jgi:hypothetical protein
LDVGRDLDGVAHNIVVGYGVFLYVNRTHNCGGCFSNVFERIGYAARPSDMKYVPWELNAAMRMVAIEWMRWDVAS